MPEELKPCPICGENMNLMVMKNNHPIAADKPYYIQCGNGCLCAGPTASATADAAITAWNALPRAPHITPNDADCKGCPERRPPQPALVWTDEPPKVPGWYWQRVAGNERSCTMAWITIEDKKLRCESVWGNRQLTRFKGFEWGGPIPRPEEAV